MASFVQRFGDIHENDGGNSIQQEIILESEVPEGLEEHISLENNADSDIEDLLSRGSKNVAHDILSQEVERIGSLVEDDPEDSVLKEIEMTATPTGLEELAKKYEQHLLGWNQKVVDAKGQKHLKEYIAIAAAMAGILQRIELPVMQMRMQQSMMSVLQSIKQAGQVTSHNILQSQQLFQLQQLIAQSQRQLVAQGQQVQIQQSMIASIQQAQKLHHLSQNQHVQTQLQQVQQQQRQVQGNIAQVQQRLQTLEQSLLQKTLSKPEIANVQLRIGELQQQQQQLRSLQGQLKTQLQQLQASQDSHIITKLASKHMQIKAVSGREALQTLTKDPISQGHKHGPGCGCEHSHDPVKPQAAKDPVSQGHKHGPGCGCHEHSHDPVKPQAAKDPVSQGHKHGPGCGCHEHSHDPVKPQAAKDPVSQGHKHGPGCGCHEHSHDPVKPQAAKDPVSQGHKHGPGCGHHDHHHTHKHDHANKHDHVHVPGSGCCGSDAKATELGRQAVISMAG